MSENKDSNKVYGDDSNWWCSCIIGVVGIIISLYILRWIVHFLIY